MRITSRMSYRATTLLPCVAVLCVVLFQSSANGLVGTTTDGLAALNCTSYTDAASCSAHLLCAWCDDAGQSSPTGICYERASGVSCCNVNNNSKADPYCEPPAQVCTAGETCYRQLDRYNPMGSCTLPVCCGSDLPQPCAPTCIAHDAVCCGHGMNCRANQTCCGNFWSGGRCCDGGAQCCTSPDGYGHWCCAEGTTCSANYGCDKR